MDNKVFFFDIDGTLTDRKTHRIVPSARRALALLQNEGHFVCLATGRAHYKTVGVMKDLNIQNAVCCGGGCIVVHGKVLKNEFLPHDKAIHILEEAEKAGIGYLLMLDDSDKAYMKDYRFLEQVGRREELTTYVYKPELDFYEVNILKIYLAVKEEEEEKYPWIQSLTRLRFAKNYLIFQYDAKKEGILSLLEEIHASPEDVVVFGDDVNDLDMFDSRWFNVAMGNGNETLKEHADYVAPKNTEHGIIRTCETYGWIPSRKEVRERFEKLILDDSIPFEETIQKEENWNFLAALNPSIAKTKGFEQRTPYHAYDVQVHIAKVVDGITREEVSEEEYRDLRIAAFLHDVGKPDVGRYITKDGKKIFIMAGHPEKSYEISEPLLLELGYEEKEIERILFLIAVHDRFLFYKPKEELWDPSQTHMIQNEENIKREMAAFLKDFSRFHPTKRDWVLMAILAKADAAAHNKEISFDGVHVVDTVEQMINRTKRLRNIFENL